MGLLIALQEELENNPSSNNFYDSEAIKKRSKNLDEKFCSECGEIIRLKAEICPKCGVRQFSNNAGLSINFGELASNGKNRITAALLALFLGGLGVHKFYLGQSGVGIIYLLFCWTFIPALFALIDFIVLITMNDTSFNQTYGSSN
jgi:TM2 domain-containing membrane protein YozV